MRTGRIVRAHPGNEKRPAPDRRQQGPAEKGPKEPAWKLRKQARAAYRQEKGMTPAKKKPAARKPPGKSPSTRIVGRGRAEM